MMAPHLVFFHFHVPPFPFLVFISPGLQLSRSTQKLMKNKNQTAEIYERINSKKQSVVSRSSSEAELRAIAQGIPEIMRITKTS